MKKHLAVVASILAFAFAACSSKTQTENENTQPTIEVNDMPTMPVTLIDSTKLVIREQPGNLILVFFLSDCEHCQRESKAISENFPAFKNYTMYFVSNESAETIKGFSEKYGLAGQPNIKFGKVELSMIIRNFGAISTPSVYIYSKERKLVKSFSGETPIEEIIRVL